MNKELYVSSTPHETRVALTEDDQLSEVFFERENEYTLAGSIYKGRVTRVLPGMQSAFVDIGLERDAFLYVSDFLEVGGEDGEEEFDDIPAGRGTVDLRPKEQQVAAPAAVQDQEEDEAEIEAVGEDFTPQNGNGEAEESKAAGDESESEEGSRRWRGRRRRRGGRRGRDEEQPSRSEASAEPGTPPPSDTPRQELRQESRHESRQESRPESRRESRQDSRQDFGPPPGYTPIILPGESISKYSGRNQQPERQTISSQPEVAPHAEDWGDEPPTIFDLAEREGESDANSTQPEQHSASERGHIATEPEQLEWAAAGSHITSRRARSRNPSRRLRLRQRSLLPQSWKRATRKITTIRRQFLKLPSVATSTTTK